MPKQIPPQESLPFPEPVPAPDHPAPDQAMASARPRTPARDVRPWWARLLGRLLDPWIALDVVPAAPGSNFDGRPVCYVLEDYGLSNALVLDRACREAGLPSPLRSLPGDPLDRSRAYVALSRRNASALPPALRRNKSHGRTHSDSLARLLEAHRADPARDVQLVPV